MHEYIVTCRSYEDLEDLYNDMETPGGSLHIPDRAVDLVHRRTISRNTHYMLTEEEAIEIRNDERVIACERLAKDLGFTPELYWTQTGNFNKTTKSFAGNDKNWGLYRLAEATTVDDWGSEFRDPIKKLTNRTITHTSSGKNVDVVIVDSHINPDHPEFAVNPDGTGGSRVNQFNWFQYDYALGYAASEEENGTYTYSTSGASPNSNHGTHVAGTAVGNTQGWARDANIYNMAFQDELSGRDDWDEKLWDYLRHFHKNKPINPATGRRNPTITNNSWGWGATVYGTYVTEFTYRGTTTTVSQDLTNTEKLDLLSDNGMPGYWSMRAPYRRAASEADIQDAIDDGVIVIAAAGNDYWNTDVSGGDDYDNTLTENVVSEITLYHSRGATPAGHPSVISVGAISSVQEERKTDFSNWGAAVDIWAPGENIISAIYDYDSAYAINGYRPVIPDSRNSSYFLASINGTSMASPQVCGVIACLLEQEPDLTQAEALQHLIESSKPEVGAGDTRFGQPVEENHRPWTNFGSSSNNRYLFAKKKRPATGTLSPAVLYKNRNPDSTGVKYPRVRSNRIIK
jgi:hypothetical protein